MVKIKSIHGHFSNLLEEEAKRIREYCKKMYNLDITFTEATAIAAERSKGVIWDKNKLKEMIGQLRGIQF